MAHFLFLEILDPEINALISAITEIISGEKPEKTAHLTVRGPYESPVPKKTLETCETAIKYDVLKISNIGRFTNPDEEVVYFQVESPHLRDIWYKPTFQISEFGFNPHLSLYRGKDPQLAELITSFLTGEKIELLCAEFRLVPYVTKQIPLIPLPDVKVYQSFPGLIGSGRIHETFISRLTRLTDQYKSNLKNSSQGTQGLLF